MEHTWIKVDDWTTLPKGITGIYRLTSPSGKMYIGKSGKCIFNRLKVYYFKNCKQQSKLYNHLVKYSNFKEWSIDYFEYPIDKCDEMEKHLIKTYNTLNNGLNLTYGGDGISIWTKEMRKKASQSKMGIPSPLKGIKRTPEVCEKISKANKGNIPPNKGLKMKAETRLKLKEITKKIYFLHNKKTFEIREIRGITDLKTFFNIENKHKDIDRLLNKIEYYKSDWLIERDGIVLYPTWKPYVVWNKNIKSSIETRKKQSEQQKIRWSLIKQSKKCEG